MTRRSRDLLDIDLAGPALREVARQRRDQRQLDLAMAFDLLLSAAVAGLVCAAVVG
jgi:hypothetical protein